MLRENEKTLVEMRQAVKSDLKDSLKKTAKKNRGQVCPRPLLSESKGLKRVKKPMLRYRLVIFDFDGTLVDTAGDIAFYANRVLRTYGFPEQSLAEVKHAIGSGVRELLIRLAPAFKNDEGSLQKAIRLFREVYTTRPVIKTVPFPGVREALAGPLQCVRKAIVTNKPQGITERILDELRLSKYFDRVIGHGDGKLKKPDGGSVLKILRGFQTAPSQAILIGDSRIDYQTAKNAGCDFAWVSYGYDRVNSKRVKTCKSAKEWTRLVLGSKEK